MSGGGPPASWGTVIGGGALIGFVGMGIIAVVLLVRLVLWMVS